MVVPSKRFFERVRTDEASAVTDGLVDEWRS